MFKHNDVIISAVNALGFEPEVVDLVFDFRDVTEPVVPARTHPAVAYDRAATRVGTGWSRRGGS